MSQFDAFYSLVKDSHHLPSEMPFTVSYTDPRNGDLLPITNSDNLMRAYTTAIPLLRLVVYRKQGEPVLPALPACHNGAAPLAQAGTPTHTM